MTATYAGLASTAAAFYGPIILQCMADHYPEGECPNVEYMRLALNIDETDFQDALDWLEAHHLLILTVENDEGLTYDQ